VARRATLDALLAAGVPPPDLRISDRAQVVLPVHIQLDVFEEERLGGQAFGSTRVGIAPFYADKYMKAGVQAGDFFDETWLRERVERCLVSRNVLFRNLYGQPVVESDSIITSLLTHANRLRSMICDAAALLHERLAADETVLVEDQLGALRDPDHGIYPYSTSSSTLAGFAAVGAGPFVTEWSGAQAEQLRQRGGDRGEFGATTGRPRRAGPFNAVATRYGCRLQGASLVALTNLDVFS
jgi:adenylosuccinate synthase